jgi:hypothetical protein
LLQSVNQLISHEENKEGSSLVNLKALYRMRREIFNQELAKGMNGTQKTLDVYFKDNSTS